jgi:predicted O-linked N-acetylglucosamine transferase (SPINDLY family)
MIREDQIDILVDLAGHTGGNRLLVFAHKPAPVQVTYLGYPSTTGMTAIDYRFTDAHADPPGMTDALCTEKLFRLPRTDWCFQPPANCPDVALLPARSNGFITFGTFNKFTKTNPQTYKLWAQILHRVPGSKLLLKGRQLVAGETEKRVRSIFAELGIGDHQLDLRGWVPLAHHLAQYHLVDIGLDTFPYHGTTTTCEALYMGVPVVTLAGDSHVARVGVSLMTNVGLPELVAQSPAEYVDIAATLAADLARLEGIRAGLRQQMEQSPLMDKATFANDVETAYRQMWAEWCHSRSRKPA